MTEQHPCDDCKRCSGGDICTEIRRGGIRPLPDERCQYFRARPPTVAEVTLSRVEYERLCQRAEGADAREAILCEQVKMLREMVEDAFDRDHAAGCSGNDENHRCKCGFREWQPKAIVGANDCPSDTIESLRLECNERARRQEAAQNLLEDKYETIRCLREQVANLEAAVHDQEEVTVAWQDEATRLREQVMRLAGSLRQAIDMVEHTSYCTGAASEVTDDCRCGRRSWVRKALAATEVPKGDSRWK